MNGFLVVDKPAGITSFDVIARLRRLLGVKRIGHAGTLDPAATGVLLIGVGRATRLLRFLETLDKEYDAGIVFGVETSTQDAEGSVTAERDASALTEDAVAAALAKFTGEIEQIPPMVSAIKVGGERLYRKARRGEEVERAPRRVTVHAAELHEFESGAHPRADVRIACSKGTYIRTIAADLGAMLGAGAHLASLRRTRIGPFAAADAVTIEAVNDDALRPMQDAVAGYPRRDVDGDDARALIQGKILAAAGVSGPYAVFGPGGFIAMAHDEGGETRSLCVVAEI